MRRQLTDSRSEDKFEDTQLKISQDQDPLKSWIDAYDETLKADIKVLFAECKADSNCSELESKYRLLQKYINQIHIHTLYNTEFRNRVEQHQNLIQEFLDTFATDETDASTIKCRFYLAVIMIFVLIGCSVGASKSSGSAKTALFTFALLAAFGTALCGFSGLVELVLNKSVEQTRNAIKQELLNIPIKAPVSTNDNPLIQISMLTTSTRTTDLKSEINLQNSINQL